VVLLQLLVQGGQLLRRQIQQGLVLQTPDIDAIQHRLDGRISLPALSQGGGKGLGRLRMRSVDDGDDALRQILKFALVRLVELLVAVPGGDQVQTAVVKG
jgi:hypothetical protein